MILPQQTPEKVCSEGSNDPREDFALLLKKEAWRKLLLRVRICHQHVMLTAVVPSWDRAGGHPKMPAGRARRTGRKTLSLHDIV